MEPCLVERKIFKQYTKYYPVVSTLIAINLTLYVLSLIPSIGTLLWNYGIQANFLIQSGEWWRVFSAMFLHAGFMHVFLICFPYISLDQS